MYGIPRMYGVPHVSNRIHRLSSQLQYNFDHMSNRHFRLASLVALLAVSAVSAVSAVATLGPRAPPGPPQVDPRAAPLEKAGWGALTGGQGGAPGGGLSAPRARGRRNTR